jgi:hypothetical protein
MLAYFWPSCKTSDVTVEGARLRLFPLGAPFRTRLGPDRARRAGVSSWVMTALNDSGQAVERGGPFSPLAGRRLG